MADDTNAAPTLEAVQAQLVASQAELMSAKERITALNSESKGHRLNADRHRGEAEAAQKARDDAIADAGKRLAEAEAAHNEAVKAAESKAQEAQKNALQRAITADLKLAAKDAGAIDVGDVLRLLDMKSVKTTDEGDVKNAAELMSELKKAKPHLFGVINTSSTTDVPAPKTTTKREDVLNADRKAYAKLRDELIRK